MTRTCPSYVAPPAFDFISVGERKGEKRRKFSVTRIPLVHVRLALRSPYGREPNRKGGRRGKRKKIRGKERTPENRLLTLFLAGTGKREKGGLSVKGGRGGLMLIFFVDCSY